ncbi:WXG100 family type VII secretion target [Streptosporangium sp. NBC_01756]|uniref:WXG100 family type VII secretion target n=1 Tax=Streptosporangium sp. NBC_01756 TaxID=2975950 RepID=UPI002DD8860B|nr:hypothetical protein [Streptosporangium sp. NBC_01756]WSC89998.1 hypothetical protein OIE48_17995 [Streptosporangium sp. NBC_01756]
MEPEPTPEQWYSWGNNPELSRSWPSPHADIDVDTAGLRKVGEAITLEVDTAGNDHWNDPKSSALGYWGVLDDYLARLSTFRTDEYPRWDADDPPRWDAFATLVRTLSGISDFVRAANKCTLQSYCDFGHMIFATSANYAMADSVFDKKISVLRYSVNGKGVHHETWKKKPYVWREDNVSDYDAPKIKAMLDSVRVETMVDKGGACTDLAAWLTNLQSVVEEHARQLAGAWQGEPAELALDAFRKMHATVRTLAHSIGTTGDTITWLAGVILQYQLNFESVVKLGGWEFDDDLPNWLLPSGGGAHDRARDYLRDLNQQLKIAYDLLPAEIEILLPTVRSDSPQPAYEKNGLKDGSEYWDRMLLHDPASPLLSLLEPPS